MRHGFDTGTAAEMVALIEEEIHGREDLERIIDLLPVEFKGAGESDFGNPEVMSPSALRGWLQGVLKH